jgi:hypothetical protein
MCLWMAVFFVISFNSPEEGNRFRNIVWCYVRTIEIAQINIADKINHSPLFDILWTSVRRKWKKY